MTKQAQGWLELVERGTSAGLWFLVVLSTGLGRTVGRAFLRLLVPYYVFFHGQARRASRSYLERIHGQADLRMIHDHLLRFAQCSLDRLFFVRGQTEEFEIHRHGGEQLDALVREQRGALLIGAHLGSFEAMQRLGEAHAWPLNIVGFFRNSRTFTSVLERLNPRMNARLIALTPESIDFVLEIRDRIGRGEFVALLADRTMPQSRLAEVEFLGSPAAFPTGPYLLAAALGCPVYLTFGLHTPPNRYDLYGELFAERVVLPRQGRDEALRQLALCYAKRLEHYCRLAPDNWFNFYDFWGPAKQTRSHPAMPPVV